MGPFSAKGLYVGIFCGRHNFNNWRREKEKMLNFDTMMKALVLQSNPAVLDDDGNTILHHLVGLIEHLMACSVSNPSSVATNVLEVIRTTNAFKSYWTKPNFKNRTPAYRYVPQKSNSTNGIFSKIYSWHLFAWRQCS